KVVVSLYGVTEQPEREVSPIAYVRPGLPPTLLIQGTLDHVVTPDNAPRMAAHLASVGDQYRLVRLPFTDHVFDLFWGDFSTQIARGVVRQFLDHHLISESPPSASMETEINISVLRRSGVVSRDASFYHARDIAAARGDWSCER